MQMPMIGTPALAALAQQAVEGERPHRLHGPRHRADAGQGDPGRGRAHDGRGRWCAPRPTPTCSKAFSTERRLPIP